MIAFRLILISFTLVLILIIFSINFSLSYYYDSGVSKKPSLILINKGLTLSEIAYLLNKEEVLEYPELFSYILRFKKLDKTIRAGEYLFPEGTTTQKVFKKKKIPFRSFFLKTRKEETLGELFTFFVVETILIAKALNINPYDQPAVELIKKETNKILVNS